MARRALAGRGMASCHHHWSNRRGDGDFAEGKARGRRSLDDGRCQRHHLGQELHHPKAPRLKPESEGIPLTADL